MLCLSLMTPVYQCLVSSVVGQIARSTLLEGSRFQLAGVFNGVQLLGCW